LDRAIIFALFQEKLQYRTLQTNSFEFEDFTVGRW